MVLPTHLGLQISLLPLAPFPPATRDWMLLPPGRVFIYPHGYSFNPRRAPSFAGIIIYVFSHSFLGTLLTTKACTGYVKTKTKFQLVFAHFSHLSCICDCRFQTDSPDLDKELKPSSPPRYQCLYILDSRRGSCIRRHRQSVASRSQDGAMLTPRWCYDKTFFGFMWEKKRNTSSIEYYATIILFS